MVFIIANHHGNLGAGQFGIIVSEEDFQGYVRVRIAQKTYFLGEEIKSGWGCHHSRVILIKSEVSNEL